MTDYAEAHGTELEIHLFGSFDPTEEAVYAFRRKMECYRFVRIVFEGFVEHMAAAYDSMDVIWHFSLTEPLAGFSLRRWIPEHFLPNFLFRRNRRDRA
ncbi:MAG: hypothetical protein V8T86_10155 [Victivallis sp.]